MSIRLVRWRPQVVLATGVVTTLAGSSGGYADGTGTGASFNAPYGVAVTPDGSSVLVADASNSRIRSIAVPLA